MNKKSSFFGWVGALLFWVLVLAPQVLLAQAQAQPNSAASADPGTKAGQGTPSNLKVAFIGDQGLE